jgi:hypothetical protein
VDLFQSEIVDEKKVRFEFKPTGTGSMAPGGLGAGNLTPRSLLQSSPTPAKTVTQNVFAATFDELLNSHFRQPQTGLDKIFPSAIGRKINKPQFRSAELEWRRTHSEALKSLENQWVAVEGSELVAHGTDLVAVIRQAKGRGVRTPYIFFVERHSDNSIKIGL